MKKLVEKGEVGDTVMTLLDFEFNDIKNNFSNDNVHEYGEETIIKLWSTMEEELQKEFELKKKHNLARSNPSRFQHYKTDLPELLALKPTRVESKSTEQSKCIH